MAPSSDIPIKIRNKVVGNIQIDEKLFADTCGKESLEVLKNAGDLLAIAIKSAGLEREITALNSVQVDFISSFPHEMRIPITVIRDALGMLRDGVLGELNSDQAKALQLASNNLERLWNLTEELLSLSVISAAKSPMKRKLFDSAALTAAVASKHNALAQEKGVALTADLPKEKMEIWGDEEKLRLVIGNLVDNAIKYNSKDGKVNIGMQDAGASVNISVSDTGAGIRPEDIGRILDKSYRVTIRASGEAKKWGIGLPVVKEIIEMHHGNISIESEVGKGSTFIITLPKNLRP